MECGGRDCFTSKPRVFVGPGGKDRFARLRFSDLIWPVGRSIETATDI
jgi:hypothetical protein